ncbi:MAG: lamin tail domain-containing protein [Bacteroidetes bacterium]|nr:lamin tail domain-containing protein [Bacteroidota bacterium]
MKTINSCIVCIACIVCIVCISFIAPAQVRDDFSDGNFTNNPEWTGDTAQFEINSSGQLHLRSSGSDTSAMFTRCSFGTSTEWSFWMKLSFNTSTNNNARIYLAADTSSLLSIVNGYFLQAGGGDDSVFIMKQTGAMVKTIYRFRMYKMFHSTNTIRFKITRGNTGDWEAMTDTTGGNNYVTDGTFFDDSFMTARWFGLMCRYTSSNATKFYFDDFYAGPIRIDTVPPRVVSMEAITARSLQVTFSEPVQKTSAVNPENYRLLSQGTRPDSVTRDITRPEVVSLFLHDSLPQGTIDSVIVRNITDLSGNRLPDTIVQICYYQPKAYDILIHEIMADPDPPVELPNGEFVELFNRSPFPITLRDWTFRYGSYLKVFPATTIPSKGYLLIVKDSAYLNIAECAVLFTSSTSLSNEGTSLVLSDSRNHVIHAVAYSPDWYRGSFKADGGWSLEMTDSSNPCGCMENWAPSTDARGGTPGRRNSVVKVNPDEQLPKALRAVISDSVLLEVTFSEAMDSTSLLSVVDWTVHLPDGAAHPVGVVPEPPDFGKVHLLSEKPFLRGITYRLQVTGNLKDCAGNNCDTSHSIRFAIPDSVTAHDVVINEILSNPASGGARFVELYNRSEHIIDLQSLVLASHDTVAGSMAGAVPLTASGYLLFPGDFIALTSGPEDIDARYRPAFPEAIAGMDDFPVFGDDTGTVIIARKDNLAIIDRMKYNPEMHYPLLATSEGVSLERTNPDMRSDDPGNWHSAAETAGFATPGYQNSHWVDPEGAGDEITIQPALFSPDNDGRDDLLIVTIREQEPDYAVNIVVYDARGRVVGQLANNVLIGSEGVFIWDGMTAARSKAPMGFYVLLVELTRPDGTVKKTKRAVVLAGKL